MCRGRRARTLLHLHIQRGKRVLRGSRTGRRSGCRNHPSCVYVSGRRTRGGERRARTLLHLHIQREKIVLRGSRAGRRSGCRNHPSCVYVPTSKTFFFHFCFFWCENTKGRGALRHGGALRRGATRAARRGDFCWRYPACRPVDRAPGVCACPHDACVRRPPSVKPAFFRWAVPARPALCI